MYLVETIKRSFERMTGRKPAKPVVLAALRKRKPRTLMFKEDGTVPNNPKLPFVIYKNAIRLAGAGDPAAVFEELFAANGWGDSWRNGIYPYLHYHSGIHEVLGVARGHARVRFGGDEGKELEIKAGDVAVLPAGTGHHCLKASRDFLVVGAYPRSGTYDECRGTAEEYQRAQKTILKVRRPTADPVYGKDGPLLQLWK